MLTEKEESVAKLFAKGFIDEWDVQNVFGIDLSEEFLDYARRLDIFMSMKLY